MSPWLEVLAHPGRHLGREIVGDDELIEAVELLPKMGQAWV